MEGRIAHSLHAYFLRRGDFNLDDEVPEAISHKEGAVTYRDWLANEGADVGIYLDIFLLQLRRDLGDVIRRRHRRFQGEGRGRGGHPPGLGCLHRQ